MKQLLLVVTVAGLFISSGRAIGAHRVLCSQEKGPGRIVLLFDKGLLLGAALKSDASSPSLQVLYSISQRRMDKSFEVQLSTGQSMSLTDSLYQCEPGKLSISQELNFVCHCLAGGV